MEKEDIVSSYWFGVVLFFAIGCIVIKIVKFNKSKTTTINVKQNDNIEYKDSFNSIPKEWLP